jgi:hypothetical protein
MQMFRVIRPVMLMECILVQAKDEADAARKVADGKGHRFYERGREPALKMENMKIEPQPDLDPAPGEKVFIITKQEDHRSHTLIVATDGEDAIEKVKDGDGFELDGTEYVDTGDSNDWGSRVFEN